MTPEEQQAYMNMQARLAQSESNTAKMSQAVTMFSGEESDNLIKWQLDIEKSLLRIERLLRKQIPKRDPKTQAIYYVDPLPENQLFNEYGVNEIMNLLSWYVNKEVILSVYQDEQIDLIMKQFGEEVIDFIYTNMENFGLDTEEKKRSYPIICMNIINIVDATYRKALDGTTLENLKTARVVNQTEPIGRQTMYPNISGGGKRFSILNPGTWKG